MGPKKQHELLEDFKRLCPNLANDIAGWGVGEENAIRINLEDKRMFVFTYNSDDEWSLETLKKYAKRKEKSGK